MTPFLAFFLAFVATFAGQRIKAAQHQPGRFLDSRRITPPQQDEHINSASGLTLCGSCAHESDSDNESSWSSTDDEEEVSGPTSSTTPSERGAPPPPALLVPCGRQERTAHESTTPSERGAPPPTTPSERGAPPPPVAHAHAETGVSIIRSAQRSREVECSTRKKAAPNDQAVDDFKSDDDSAAEAISTLEDTISDNDDGDCTSPLQWSVGKMITGKLCGAVSTTPSRPQLLHEVEKNPTDTTSRNSVNYDVVDEGDDEFITLRGYHGTGLLNVPWIHLLGFHPSATGFYGPGLYLTNTLATAEHYAAKHCPLPITLLVTFRVRKDRLYYDVLLRGGGATAPPGGEEFLGNNITTTDENYASRSPARRPSKRILANYREVSPTPKRSRRSVRSRIVSPQHDGKGSTSTTSTATSQSQSHRRRTSTCVTFPEYGRRYDVLFRVNQILVQPEKVEILDVHMVHGTALGVRLHSYLWNRSPNLTEENLEKLGFAREEIESAVA
ncbi:unnamed protein product [Amoebophrya sp. A120]|nr:unnamed protein product [Amoebophrya sp. A120]|eukprot:GSA120T00018812001.1